jgi:proton-dependent oligopeptide transporter, POT family
MKISKLKKILKQNQNEKYERVVCDDDTTQKIAQQKLSFFSSMKVYFLTLGKKLQNDWSECQTAIKNFPKEIYFIFYLKFLESYSYFALSQVFVIYLHTEFHVSDIEAGMVYGMWSVFLSFALHLLLASHLTSSSCSPLRGAAITLWGLMVSWVNDNLGVRRSLILGFTISAISSTIVASTTSKAILYFTIFAIYPFGTSMGIPMLTVAIKRYTTLKRRGFAFGLYYSVMNVAALVSGPVVDLLNIGLRDGLSLGSHLHLSGNRLVIMTCTVSNLLSLWIALRYIREIKIAENEEEKEKKEDEEEEKEGVSESEERDEGTGGSSRGTDDDLEEGRVTSGSLELITFNPSLSLSDEKQDPDSHSSPGPTHTTTLFSTDESLGPVLPLPPPSVQEYQPQQHHPLDTAKELLHSPTFWRFAILTLLLVNLHAIFRHLDATEPTYLVRCFGSNVPKGTLYSINPFMIIFLTPLVAMLTSGYDHFDMIKWGGYLTAASPFFPALSTTLWAVIGMNVLLSLGEAIWSPRLYDYVMTIAPEVADSLSLLSSHLYFPPSGQRGFILSPRLCSTLCCKDSSGIDERLPHGDIPPRGWKTTAEEDVACDRSLDDV